MVLRPPMAYAASRGHPNLQFLYHLWFLTECELRTVVCLAVTTKDWGGGGESGEGCKAKSSLLKTNSFKQKKTLETFKFQKNLSSCLRASEGL